jgi:hypothetical protein
MATLWRRCNVKSGRRVRRLIYNLVIIGVDNIALIIEVLLPI